MTDIKLTPNPGVDVALDAIESAAKYGRDYTTQWAVDFLGLLIPVDHPAYTPFCVVRDSHDRLRDRGSYSQKVTFVTLPGVVPC
jgi:hypothetical protein